MIQNENIVSFKIERTGDSLKPLAFEEQVVRQWITNLSPYVQAIEDKIIIAQGGVVRESIDTNVISFDIIMKTLK